MLIQKAMVKACSLGKALPRSKVYLMGGPGRNSNLESMADAGIWGYMVIWSWEGLRHKMLNLILL